MRINFLKICLFGFLFLASSLAHAQKKKTTKKSTPKKTNIKVTNPNPSTVTAPDTVKPVVSAEAPVKKDSLPIKQPKPSLKPDQTVMDVSPLRDKTPLSYEHLRTDDVVFRHRLWREIDCKEKMNMPFMYDAEMDNGNQMFITILLRALEDSTIQPPIIAFNGIDDRFTTPMTREEIIKKISGDSVQITVVDTVVGSSTYGQPIGTRMQLNEINFKDFTKYHIKEEVIFDKESSRLFWRILGIAPVKDIYNQGGDFLGVQEMFWVYYPDLRGVLSKFQVYNGKNFETGMSWFELFENRKFSGRIYKSSLDNSRNALLTEIPGMDKNPFLQLLEGENIKNKIQNAEQNVWSY